MIEYTYRTYVVQQRGNRHRILGLDRELPNEAAVRKAIDIVLDGKPRPPEPEPAPVRRRQLPKRLPSTLGLLAQGVTL